MSSRIVCIQGPTASGKSELAEKLAHYLDGEIISADSMQIYKEMDIGTAKVPQTKRTVPYHCIDICNPNQAYSAALFQRDARKAIEIIQGRKKTPIICGGTGLYVRAALDDMNFAKGEQENNAIRKHYQKIADEQGGQVLYALLQKVDYESSKFIHPNNVVRVIRALEMHDNGDSYAKRKNNFKKQKSIYNSIYIALRVDKNVLNKRINQRVDMMIEHGLINEVQSLLKKGFRKALTAQYAIGYKEIVSYIDGEISLLEAIDAIKQSSRRYAKRQRTWLRGDARNVWIDCDSGITDDVVKNTLRMLYD